MISTKKSWHRLSIAGALLLVLTIGFTLPAPAAEPTKNVQCQTCGEIFPQPPEGFDKVICPACGAVATEKKPVEDPTPKISDKPEIKEAKAEPPPPMPEPRPQPPKREEAKKPPEPKVDPIAEALKRDTERQKREAQKEKKLAAKPKPRKQEQPRFDPDKVAALLDRREPS